MQTDAFLAYGHFLAMFLIVATVAVEMALCRPGLRRQTAKFLARVDIVYFVAAIFVLITGGLRLFLGLKGTGFYLGNPAFYVKMGLFLLVGLISILPTLQFIRWSRQSNEEMDALLPTAEVARVARWVRLEFGLLLLIPLVAALMARGIGY